MYLLKLIVVLLGLSPQKAIFTLANYCINDLFWYDFTKSIFFLISKFCVTMVMHFLATNYLSFYFHQIDQI
jgi:hypothetical protein